MFPIKCCGLWTLIASTNPQYIGSELKINYNAIIFTPIKRVGPINIKKNIYGSVFLKENEAKIIWLNKINYDIDTGILPRISIPYTTQCPRMAVTYEIDESTNWITIKKQNEQYVFRREISISHPNDTIFKLFITQLFFDFIIRHIYNHAFNLSSI
jgi:hypothetical protein